jgi:hypothetical protein
VRKKAAHMRPSHGGWGRGVDALHAEEDSGAVQIWRHGGRGGRGGRGDRVRKGQRGRASG